MKPEAKGGAAEVGGSVKVGGAAATSACCHCHVVNKCSGGSASRATRFQIMSTAPAI